MISRNFVVIVLFHQMSKLTWWSFQYSTSLLPFIKNLLLHRLISLVIVEIFCMKLTRLGVTTRKISCISDHHYISKAMHHFSESAWLNLLKEKAFPKDTIILLIHKVNMFLTENHHYISEFVIESYRTL